MLIIKKLIIYLFFFFNYLMSTTVKLLLIPRLFGHFSHSLSLYISNNTFVLMAGFFLFSCSSDRNTPFFVSALTESPHFNTLRDEVCLNTSVRVVPAAGFLFRNVYKSLRIKRDYFRVGVQLSTRPSFFTVAPDCRRRARKRSDASLGLAFSD